MPMTSIPGPNDTNKTDEDRNSAATLQAERQKQLDGLRNFRGRLPADFKFDREEANSRQT
jgi:hypothetical protein